MKLLITAASLVLFTINHCHAQSAGRQNILSLSAGIAVPAGNFANNNTANDFAGYAKAGENASLSFEHKLRNSSWRLVATLYGQRNAVNAATLAQQLDQKTFAEGGVVFGTTGPGQPLPPVPYIHYPNWTVAKSCWYTEALLVGVSREFSVGAGSNLSFVAKIQLGAAHTTIPKLNAASSTDTVLVSIKENSVSGFGFACLANGGIRYHLNRHFSFVANLGWFQTSKISLKNITESMLTLKGFVIPNLQIPSNAQGIAISTATSSGKQPVSSLNLSAGIELRL